MQLLQIMKYADGFIKVYKDDSDYRVEITGDVKYPVIYLSITQDRQSVDAAFDAALRNDLGEVYFMLEYPQEFTTEYHLGFNQESTQ